MNTALRIIVAGALAALLAFCWAQPSGAAPSGRTHRTHAVKASKAKTAKHGRGQAARKAAVKSGAAAKKAPASLSRTPAVKKAPVKKAAAKRKTAPKTAQARQASVVRVHPASTLPSAANHAVKPLPAVSVAKAGSKAPASHVTGPAAGVKGHAAPPSGPPVKAKSDGQPAPGPQPAPEGTAPEYQLQREDVLHIQLLDRDQADVSQDVQVGRDGRITPPFLAPLVVEGMSLSELRTILAQAYEKELNIIGPKVSVVLVKIRDMRASVVGAVRSPGAFAIRPGDRVLNLLSLAGDALPEAQADLRRATLTRAKSREIIPIDVVALRLGDLSQNYEVLDGDILNVPQEQGLNRVLVWGKVKTPGAYPFIEGMTVMDALTQAGGEIANQSRFSRVQVIREAPGAPGTYVRVACNIVDYIKKGDFRQNIKLQRRDVVVVPDTGNPNFDQFNQVVGLIFVLERFGINIFKF